VYINSFGVKRRNLPEDLRPSIYQGFQLKRDGINEEDEDKDSNEDDDGSFLPSNQSLDAI